MIALWAALACTSQPEDPVRQALEAGADLESCAAVAFPELAIPCRVTVAARAGGQGDVELARRACEEVPEGLWREECHFRAGEELGRAGHTDPALRFCAVAGDFARNCVTHAAWGLPADPALREAHPAAVRAAMQEFGVTVDQALAGAEPGVAQEARDTLLARAWFNLYVGSGQADPAPARLAEGEHGPHARTAFAAEAVRLLATSSAEDLERRVLAVWAGDAPVPRGEPLPPERRVGRYVSPVVPTLARGLPHAATYGGGFRLVGESPEQDLRIAALEALFFREATPAESFAARVEDPEARVALTAWKLWALTGDPDAVRAAAAQVSGEQAPLVQAYVDFALSKDLHRRR